MVSLSAFASLSRAINVAFGTDPTYRFWMSQLKAFAAVTISAMLLVLSAASIHALAWLDRYRESLELPPVLGPGAMWGSFALSMIVSFTAFFVFYKMLPHGRVSWRASATGALVALALFLALHRGSLRPLRRELLAFACLPAFFAVFLLFFFMLKPPPCRPCGECARPCT